MVRVLLFVLLLSVPLASADLAVGFYDSSCPQAESVVRAVVAKHFHADHSIAAAFLRLYFHDCFVRVSIRMLSMYLSFTLNNIVHARMHTNCSRDKYRDNVY